MEISFSQSFLDNLERIDNKVVIDGFSVDSGEIQTSFQIICHGKNIQVCVEGVSGECGRLDFYCGEEIGFWITGEGIVMNPERTIFEFDLPSEPKAIIECPWNTEDTNFLEGIGSELGNSLYKDIPVSNESLVWKETLGKYIVDRGLQDNHLYDVELLDTKSGVLEERPIRFKSYQNILIEQGNWEVDMIKKSVVVKHDIYDNISSSSFLVWDSPMIDAKVNLEKDPKCINKIGEYVDPGNIIFGNTDCFQFINYQSNLVGFRITGTEGSDIEVLFNRESSEGSYTSFRGIIGNEGSVEIRFSDLPYLHLNGIRAIGPSRVTQVETIMFLEETVDDYSPNPDKTYVAKLDNKDCILRINGVCDYIEYEKYLGEIKEIGRGTEHIDSIPGILITSIENGGLNHSIMSLEKQVKVFYNSGLGATSRYVVLQVKIDNNINVDGNIIMTSPLTADYKIRIEQTGIIWRINNSPDYINIDEVEGEHGIFLLGHEKGSTRSIEIITNDSRAISTRVPVIYQDPAGRAIFEMTISWGTSRIIDGDWWSVYNLKIKTLSANTEGVSWRPKKPDTDNPYLVTFKFLEESIPFISFYAIQLKNIENPISIWEETVIPGKFTKVESKTTLLNTITKNFIVTKEGLGEEHLGLNWYYYDLLGTNKFYITDQNFQTTNVGSEYLVAPNTTLLDLGTGELRATFGRVINVNRSDLIGSLGTLVATESPAYPRTWRDLIDNNTVSIEVERVLDNIYIRVGEDISKMKDEDYVVNVDSICAFPIFINSNFKFVIQTYGYLKIYPKEEYSKGKSGYEFPDRREVFKGYNINLEYSFALVELDEDKDMEESYIEIRSGNVVRKITLNINGPKKEHDYLIEYPDTQKAVEKPNLIRIFANGAIAPDTKKKFLYTSTTTPKIEVKGVNDYPGITDPLFFYEEFDDNYYGYHSSEIPISVPNSKSLSYSKYPMKSFGYIREMSQNYSESETISSTGATSYLEYPLYMKGKEHFLWCVDNLGGFSNISDPTIPKGSTEVSITSDMPIDANGESGKTVYVISRYSVDNRTFITESPEETEYKIKRNDLEANIKILPQQTIALDERSQIEYAIPIQVSCNVENNGGNIFLGSVDYKAITKITEDSISDVIEVENNIIELEEIDSDYIIDQITSDKTQNLSVMIYQLGTDKRVFKIYSDIPDLGIWATSNYVIPEIGSDYTITGLNVTKSSTGSGSDIVTVSSEFDKFNSKYFLVKVDSEERVKNTYWYSPSSLPTGLINDTQYTLKTAVSYKDGNTIKSTTFTSEFTKYGCNYGLYVNVNGMAMAGFGVSDTPTSKSSTRISVSNKGGEITINAGIFHATNGIDDTEALMVPSEYKFIGENQPIEFSWTNGNKDDKGNLRIVLPPRTRDEDGDKSYILQVSQPHEYYPIKLYIEFYQPSLRGSSTDTGKNDYKLMFLDEEVNIMSDGTVVGNEEKKFYFVHNLPESEFDKVSFSWKQKDRESWIPFIPDELQIEELERSYKEGYVKFKIKPNGSHMFIDAYITAYYKVGGDKREIGQLSAKQGYFCLISEYYNPYIASSSWIQNYKAIKNPMSRISPISNFLYKYSRSGGTSESSDSTTPCKSNDDNANSSIISGRGVFSLTAWKKEYYDEREIKCDLSSIFKESDVIYISPVKILESYSFDFVYDSSSSNDKDAKVNPNVVIGKSYATDTNFSQYCPYFELSYVVKDEYIKEDGTITASGKFTLKHPDTGDLTDFYILFSTDFFKSDEPDNIDLLEFSDYNLKFDCEGGIKQVSYSPASFGSMMDLEMVDSSVNWIVANHPSDSNYLIFTADENKSTDSESAYYRTTQAKIDVRDSRNRNYILKSFYINLEQEPDITQTESGEGGGGGGKIPSNIYVNVKLINSTGKQVPITGEIKMYVGGHNGIFISLPGASSSSTLMTLGIGEQTSDYFVNCVGNGVTPSDYLDQPIDSGVIVYAPDGSYHNSSMIGATISGNGNVFSNNASYVVTLNSYEPAPEPPEPPVPTGNTIYLEIVNNSLRSDPIYLCGFVTIDVLNDEGTPIYIDTNLPVTSYETNVYTIPPEAGSIAGPFEVTCTGDDHIEDLFGNQLGGNVSAMTHFKDGSISDSYYRPYSISAKDGTNIFERGHTYVITFERVRSLARGTEDDAITPTLPPTKEETK